MARTQAIAHAPFVYAALDESALRWQLGGPSVMAEQLEHLEELATRPNVMIQVVPFSMGVHRSFASAVTLLTIGDNNTQLGYTETLHRGFLERDRTTVTRWRRRYDCLQVDAPPRAESLTMIRRIRKELAP
ncbi:Scr1 family TA system antitoxin-like transcriptional regulator [Kitasatospora sp. NPDC001660]